MDSVDPRRDSFESEVRDQLAILGRAVELQGQAIERIVRDVTISAEAHERHMGTTDRLVTAHNSIAKEVGTLSFRLTESNLILGSVMREAGHGDLLDKAAKVAAANASAAGHEPDLIPFRPKQN